MLSSALQEQWKKVHSWTQEFDKLAERIAPRFARAEAREQAKGYLQGLLSSVERKNGWQLAEALGQSNPYGLQNLLGRAVWDADALRDDLIKYVIEELGDDEGVLILDESGFLKKGDKSVGVARQYSGTAGRIENSQIGVFVSYATPKGHTFLDRKLYLPKEWTDDKERCEAAGVPDTVVFATKPKIARALLERAFLAKVPCRWVTGDAVYGNDRRLQMWLQEQGVGHVLAVSGQEMVTMGYQHYRVKELLPTVPEDAWQIHSCGEGSKGERLYAWAWLPIHHGHDPQWGRWLVVRKSLADPTELTGYIAFAPADTPLQTLVRVAGSRWSIECCFESAKGEVGLDEYEVRSWHGWHRHMSLSMLAHAFLAVQRAEAGEDAKKGMSQLPGRQTASSLRTFKQSRGLLCA